MKAVPGFLITAFLFFVSLQVPFSQSATNPQAQSRLDTATRLLAEGRYADAMEQALLGRRMQLATLPATHIDLARSSFLIGEILNNQSLHTNAIVYLDSALMIMLANGAENSLLYADALHEKGMALTYSGQYEKAGPVLTQELALRRKLPEATEKEIANSYLALGILNERLKNFDNAFNYFHQSLEIFLKSGGQQSDEVAFCYSQILQVCLHRRDYAKALDYGLKEQAIMVQTSRDTHPDFGYVCHDLGNVYFALKNFPEAVQWQKKALSIFKQHYDGSSEDISAMYLYVGQALAGNGNYREAIDSCMEDIRLLQHSFGADYFYQFSPEALMGYCYWKLYLTSGDKTWLDTSRACFKKSFQRIVTELQIRNLASVRKAILSNAVSIAGNYLQVECEFFQQFNDSAAVENAWDISEFMHGYLLNAASQEAHARHFAGIPDELIREDSLIRIGITNLEEERNDLIESGSANLNDSIVLAFDVRIYALRNEFSRLQHRFEKDFPGYFKLKYERAPVPLEKIQQLLAPQQTLVEYFAGDTSLFVLLVHPDRVRLISLPLDSAMSKWVKQFREGITGYHISRQKNSALYVKTLRQYVEAGQKLYNLLVLPVEADLTPELIIVPSESLADLPFEALLAGAPADLGNFGTFPFMLRKYSIQYAYSARNLAFIMSDRSLPRPPGEVLAMAPFVLNGAADNTRSGMRSGFDFSPLPFSGEEIKRVKQHFDQHSIDIYGKDASKKQFWALAPSYAILHLATHGKANNLSGEFSFLAFSADTSNTEAGFVTAGELYNCNLNADLVTLSACETGIGELQRGEGMASLARAFTFAGARTVVSSLWNVNDNSTMAIMDVFYQELSEGKPKNLALATAKRQYLEKNPGLLQHPFYWAAFISAGDYRPLFRN